MPDIPTEPANNQPGESPIKTTTEKMDFKVVLAIVAVLVLIALIWWLWARFHAPKPLPQTVAVNPYTTTYQAGGRVEGAFTPPQPTEDGTSPAIDNNPPANISNIAPISPRGPQTPPSAAPATTNPPAQISQNNVYQNSQLGFSLTLPANWHANAIRGNEIDFFDVSTGKEIGYMEIYTNVVSTTLDVLMSSLLNSPDISGVTHTTLGGQPALAFLATTQFKNGLAAIYNNRVYYLWGALAKPPLSDAFKFN